MTERRRFDPYDLLTAVVIANNAIARHYQSSFLGLAWILITPAVQVGIFAVIMPLLIRSAMPHYVVFLVSTFPLWSFIVSSLVVSTSSLVSRADTIKRCMVSTTVFPLADVLRQFYTFAVSVYSIDMVPAHVQHWMYLNPAYLLMRPIYLLAYVGDLPGVGDTLRAWLVTTVAVSAGYAIHRACRRNFVYYL